jgi:hypothetical protein
MTGKLYKGHGAVRITAKTYCALHTIRKAFIKYRKPDGKIGRFAALITDAENGVIYYECRNGDINQGGWWVFWACITFEDGRTAAGEAARVFVWDEGK